jgi:hypothetical protein
LSYGLAQPAPDAPNLAPLKPLQQFLDTSDKPCDPFPIWIKTLTGQLEQERSLEWRELSLIWELVNKFIEGKQILRRRHRGFGWDVLPMPETTTGGVREQNKIGFYEQVLMQKWVSSRTKIAAIPGDDSDQATGAARAAQVWYDAVQDLVYNEVFRQTEAKSAHVHGTYARYFYFDPSDESGGYGQRPITEQRTYKSGEDSAECLDCGYSGVAGEFGAAQELRGSPPESFANTEMAAGSPASGSVSAGIPMQSVSGYAGIGQPMAAEAAPAINGAAISTGVVQPSAEFAGSGEVLPSQFEQPGQSLLGAEAENNGALACPACSSPNVEVIPAEEIPIEVVTGTTKHTLGQLKAISVPYSEIRHEITTSLECSPWARWKRRVRHEEIKAKWPKLKPPAAQTMEKDYGLEYEESMIKSTAVNNPSAQGANKERKNYADFAQWWLQPCMYQDYTFPEDMETVAGEVIPAGTKATDIFPDGMYVAMLDGQDTPLQVCNESHKWHWVTAPYHLRLFTGLGLGIQDGVEMQRQWNVNLGLVYTQIRTAALPGWIYDKDAIEPDSVRKLGQPQNSVPVSLRNRPDGTSIEKLVHRMEPGQIPSHIPWYVGQLDANMQTAMGALVNSGLPGNNNSTATGAQLNDQAGNQHNAPEFALKGDADQRSAYVLFELAKRHYVEPRYIPLSGKRGKQDGIWLSQADFGDGQVKFQALRDSWIPNSRFDKQEAIKALLLIFGGIEGLMMAQQTMPDFVDEVAEAFNVDIAGDMFEPTALICRQRVDQIKDMAPQYAQLLPQMQMMAEMQEMETQAAVASLSPEEQQMAAEQGAIPPPMDPMAMLGDQMVAALMPPPCVEEPAHQIAIKWLRDLLLDDEMKEADQITRAGVFALIRTELQLAAQEAQMMAALSQIANPQPEEEEQPKGKQPEKTEKDKRKDNAKSNLRGASAKQGTARPKPEMAAVV